MNRGSRQVWILASCSVVALIVAAAAVVAYARSQDTYEFTGGFWEPGRVAPALDLVDQNGRPFSLDDHAGKVVLVYFGYTYCPDYCPTTLLELQQVKHLLGDRADQVEIVMISVDPERDSPQRLKEYLDFFDPTFHGLSGSPEAIERIKLEWGVVSSREDHGTAGYFVNHSTTLFAVDPAGNLRLNWAYEAAPDDIADDIRHLL